MKCPLFLLVESYKSVFVFPNLPFIKLVDQIVKKSLKITKDNRKY